MQAHEELIQWLESSFNISHVASSKLRARLAALPASRTQVQLATAQANMGALSDVLHMDDSQARSGVCAGCMPVLCLNRSRSAPRGRKLIADAICVCEIDSKLTWSTI